MTISQVQHDFARRRLFEAGLAERTDIRMLDYRDVEGRFDRVASIEMFEVVGREYWPGYFDKIREVLVPAARAGLQIITIPQDALFEDYNSRSRTSSRNTSSRGHAAVGGPAAAGDRPGRTGLAGD